MKQNANLPTHVLLVEDHLALAASVCEYLEHMGMVVDHAANASLAIQLLKQIPFNIVILDINLPDGSGFDICQSMRFDLGLSTPVIMLTARDTLADKLTGFDMGGDDYVLKPFDLPELVARIQALVKRSRGEVGDHLLTVGDLTLSVARREVHRQMQRLELSPLLFKLLHLLMRESPKPVSKHQIIQELWSEDAPDSDSLRSHLYMLRKLIDKPYKQPLIHTLPGQGIILKQVADS